MSAIGHDKTGKPKGRPPGSRTRKTREIAERAAAQGIEPLEVMLQAMRLWVDLGEWDKALVAARDAAPYCHPRLSSVEHKGLVSTVALTMKAAAEIEQELYDEYLQLGLSDAKARALVAAATGSEGSPRAGEAGGKPN